MESDERSIRIQWKGRSERDGQKYIYTRYEKIKNTVRRGGWRGEVGREREKGRGRNSRARGAREVVSGRARRALRRRGSHTYVATHSAEKPTSAPTNNYPYYPIL